MNPEQEMKKAEIEADLKKCEANNAKDREFKRVEVSLDILRMTSGYDQFALDGENWKADSGKLSPEILKAANTTILEFLAQRG